MNTRTYRVVGLGFGDEGKGSVVDFLARQCQAPLIIRYNGGPQAAHNVVTPDGRHHTFSQFGSGMFHPNARTYLSRFMLIDPLTMQAESDHLNSVGMCRAEERTFIDEDCIIITPYHVALNRLREAARGAARHGSCGAGVGEARADDLARPDLTLRAGMLRRTYHNLSRLQDRLEDIRRYKYEQTKSLNLPPLSPRPSDQEAVQWAMSTLQEGFKADGLSLADMYVAWASRFNIVGMGRIQELHADVTIFEGAQGVLLDETYGFPPYNTWTDTTLRNADVLCEELGLQGENTSLGVTRSYFTRHGAGPFPTEGSLFVHKLTGEHNTLGPWQGDFRTGALDLVLLRYALLVLGGVDGLVVTWVGANNPTERLTPVCTHYLGRNSLYYRELPLVYPVTPADLKQQEHLTRFLLQDVRPHYMYITPQDIPACLEAKLQTPVRLLSYGPTADDKRWVTTHRE